MIELKHQKNVIALIVGGIVLVNADKPNPFALVTILLSILAFCASTCASLVKRTPYEKGMNSPKYCLKDKIELGGTIIGYIFSACALLTFTFSKETTIAWIVAIFLFLLVIAIAAVFNMKQHKNAPNPAIKADEK